MYSSFEVVRLALSIPTVAYAGGGVMCVKHPPWVCPKNKMGGGEKEKEKGEREKGGKEREEEEAGT